MQYSTFNNPERVVRDVTSTAQAICVEDLVTGHYEHANVTLYISVAMILPISTTIAGTFTILCNYGLVLKKAQDDQQRPQIVGAAITGTYILLYIMISDIAAVYIYIQGWDDYSRINSSLHNSLQLELTWATLIIEYSTSILALFVCVVFVVSKHWCDFRDCSHYTFQRHLSSLRKDIRHFFVVLTIATSLFSGICLSIVYSIAAMERKELIIAVLLSSILLLTFLCSLFWISKGKTIYLCCYIVIPVIFISAHIGYIFAAWLTEPSKTTSVSILALSIILYMFILSRLVYHKIHSAFSKCKREWLNDERLLLIITFVIVFFGVSLVALNVSAFYLLPIPTVKLADYVDNIFQISLVIFAALISYKILSHKDSEAKRFFKKFNNVFQKDPQIPGSKDAQFKHKHDGVSFSEQKEATMWVKFVWDNVKVSKSKMKRNLTCPIIDHALIVQINGHDRKKFKIPADDVILELGSISAHKTQIRIPLHKANLTFRLLSSKKGEKVVVPLTEATIGSISVSEYDLHIVLLNEDKPVASLIRNTLSCANEGIMLGHPDADKKLVIPFKCYNTNKQLRSQGGAYCQFDCFVSLLNKANDLETNGMLKTWNDEIIDQLVVPFSSLKINVINDSPNGKTFVLGSGKIIFKDSCAENATIELKRQFMQLRYSIKSINQFTISTSGTHLKLEYRNETVISVPMSKKFTSVLLVTSRDININGGAQNIRVESPASITFTSNGNGDSYKVGNTQFLTQNDPTLNVRVNGGCDIICLQQFSVDTTFILSRDYITVQYEDNGRVEWKVPSLPAGMYKLELICMEQDDNSSYLYIPSSQSTQPQDVFENAGNAFGQIALSMASDKAD